MFELIDGWDGFCAWDECVVLICEFDFVSPFVEDEFEFGVTS